MKLLFLKLIKAGWAASKIFLLLIAFPIVLITTREVFLNAATWFTSVEDGWVSDIEKLKTVLIEEHAKPNWFTDKTTDRITQKATDLKEYVTKKKGEVDRDHMRVELMKMSALLRDGHTRITNYAEEVGKLPVNLQWFQDGLYITEVDETKASALGKRIVAVNGEPINAVIEKLAEICPHSQESGLKMYSEIYLARPGLLAGLGITESKTSTTFSIQDAQGNTELVTLETTEKPASRKSVTDLETYTEGLYAKYPQKDYWFEYFPQSGLLYLRYRQVISTDPPMESFIDSLMQFADSKNIEKFIIDLRDNSGGDNFLTVKLVSEIKKRTALNQKGVLYAITNYITFSAAISLLGNLSAKTHTLIAGTPAGDFNNAPGDSKFVNLRNTDFTWSVSELFWENTFYGDYRNTLQPQLPDELSYAEWVSGKTPLIDQILADTTQFNWTAPQGFSAYSGRYQFSPDRTLHLDLTEGEVSISGFLESTLSLNADSTLKADNLRFSLKLENEKVFIFRNNSDDFKELQKLKPEESTALETMLNGDLQKGKELYLVLLEKEGNHLYSLRMNNLSALAAYVYQMTGDVDLQIALLELALEVDDSHIIVLSQMAVAKLNAGETWSGYYYYALTAYHFDWANIINYGKMFGFL